MMAACSSTGEARGYLLFTQRFKLTLWGGEA
jgi:hypothetical protein